MTASELPIGLRRVLVTGGGTGIGRAIAEALVHRGGRVVVCGRRPGPLDELARSAPGQVHALPGDIADPSFRDTLLDRSKALLGGLDGFVHSAGAVVHEPPGHISESALRLQLEVNLVAPLRLGELALSRLERGGGLVFVASTLAQRPVRTSAAYSAAKAGLLAAMQALALEGAPRGIRANAVNPGVVDTEMVRVPRLAPGERLTSDESLARIESQLAGLRALHPLGRLGVPADVAEAVLHLLGAPWTTGATLTVDGGLLLHE